MVGQHITPLNITALDQSSHSPWTPCLFDLIQYSLPKPLGDIQMHEWYNAMFIFLFQQHSSKRSLRRALFFHRRRFSLWDNPTFYWSFKIFVNDAVTYIWLHCKLTHHSYLCLFLQVAKYYAGMSVCVIVGILFVIVMPLVGCCFCCCRLCNNCGGRMKQKQKSAENNCCRMCLTITLLILTLFMA